MKAIPFHIPKTHREVFRVQCDTLPYFYDRLHLHNEIQFTLIEAGTGTLIAGDYVGRFNPGDVYIIGKQLPHVFRCDSHYYTNEVGVSGISVFFDESYAGIEFWENDELQEAKEWLNRSGQGYAAQGSINEKMGSLLRQMVPLGGLDKLIAGFNLLRLGHESQELVPLSLQDAKNFRKEILGERIDRVIRFTFREHHRPILIEEVASLVSLSPSAFCRFFKLRTRKTYLTFINEIRISHACRLLVTTDLPVSEICYRVGFNNISHFNDYFKKLKSTTPTTFRHSFTS